MLMPLRVDTDADGLMPAVTRSDGFITRHAAFICDDTARYAQSAREMACACAI